MVKIGAKNDGKGQVESGNDNNHVFLLKFHFLNMSKKEIVREVLDLDHGIVSTFLLLFSDPKKVVTNPDKFTKPWKYATYVTSISCLFTWFVIHYFIDVQDEESFWLVPKRMLELATGYQSFYENTQPLKRLVLGALSLYVAMLIFLFKERNQ